MTTESDALVAADVLLAEGIEALLWCREHSLDAGASTRLRELELTLAALALGIDSAMAGDPVTARDAARRADSLGILRYVSAAELEGC